MNTFEAFLRRKASGGKEAAPFLAALWLHTNHDPHPALPQYYYAYNDSHGAPAGQSAPVARQNTRPHDTSAWRSKLLIALHRLSSGT